MADPPSLDDRRFQDLVDDAMRFLAARRTVLQPIGPDSQAAVVEAAALMVDQLLYRLNQIPDTLHHSLLDLLGVQRYPAQAARTTLTFWLAADLADGHLVVPEGTQVSAPAADGPTFSTVQPLRLDAVQVVAQYVSLVGEESPPARATRLHDIPVVGDAFLVGLSVPAPSTCVALEVRTAAGNLGINPARPPLTWEAWTGTQWQRCPVHTDESGGLSRSGRIVLRLPDQHVRMTIGSHAAAWLRARVVADTDEPAYRASPEVTGWVAATVGGEVEAVHGRRIAEELLGISDGRPGQRFTLRSPVVPQLEGYGTVEVMSYDGWRPWMNVVSFADSDRDDPDVQIDATQGEVRFGPTVRRRDGGYDQYGQVPLAGAMIRLTNHLVGGGAAGNVGLGVLTRLETPVPYVARVENIEPATGGTEAETEAEARTRIPLTIRTRGRAVTAEDYEALAREAAPDVARVTCVPGDEPGSVRLLVIPWVAAGAGQLAMLDLQPSDGALRRIANYLEERRVIGTRLIIEPARYVGVTVVVRVRRRPGIEIRTLHARVLEALNSYFHPISGASTGTGWPFGRPVVLGEAFAVVQRVPDADLVEDLKLFATDPVTGERGPSVQRIDVPPDGVVFSYEHVVQVVDG